MHSSPRPALAPEAESSRKHKRSKLPQELAHDLSRPAAQNAGNAVPHDTRDEAGPPHSGSTRVGVGGDRPSDDSVGDDSVSPDGRVGQRNAALHEVAGPLPAGSKVHRGARADEGAGEEQAPETPYALVERSGAALRMHRLEPRVRRMLRQYQRDIFPVDESPGRVAGSVFAGAFIGVMPTLGIALPLTWLATAVLKLPKGPGMVASFIATPPTLFFFFYPLGYFGVGLPLVKPPAIDFDFLTAIGSLNLSNMGELGRQLWSTAQGHVLAFLVGMSIVAAITAALCGWIAFVVMRRKQARA